MLTPHFGAVNVTRRARRTGLALLPSRQRARLRAWYEAATAPAVRSVGFVTSDGTALTIQLRDGLRFSMLPAAVDDIGCRLDVPQQAAELEAFRRDSAPGLFFDIGANNGVFSLVHCQTHRANRVIAFEPSPLFADRMETHGRMNGIAGRQIVIRKAVGKAIGSCDMLVNRCTGWVQIEAFAGTAGAEWSPHAIETTTIDREADNHGAPSTIKIDVEGYEWEVLQGAEKVLTEAAPVVFLELHLNYLEERGLDPERVLHCLTSRDYSLSYLSGRPVSAARAARSWANVLHLVARHAR